MAGTSTSANTLEIAIFSLLDGPAHMLERLMQELREAIPDEDNIVGWAKLEELPYLVSLQSGPKCDERVADHITRSAP